MSNQKKIHTRHGCIQVERDKEKIESRKKSIMLIFNNDSKYSQLTVSAVVVNAAGKATTR
jgi:hypothetical protein